VVRLRSIWPWPRMPAQSAVRSGACETPPSPHDTHGRPESNADSPVDTLRGDRQNHPLRFCSPHRHSGP
jgi:hypothetical protein